MTGIICLDKPKGITSFGAVARMRKIANEKKIGHCGTLDPMATGVLPLMLGGTTRFLDFIPNHDKAYTATFRLGLTTDTLDITGNVLKTSEVTSTKKDVEDVLSYFRGNISQVPPMYSAISQDGVRLYELARKGIEVERKSRQVDIYSLKLLENENALENEYIIDVDCSKGTYIRTLVQDIGEKLGCGATLTELRRTKAAGFSLDDCLTLEQALERKENGGLDNSLINLEYALRDYKKISVTAPQSKRFSNGGELDLVRVRGIEKVSSILRVYSDEGLFLGLGEVDLEKNALTVKRVFVRGE